jgi:hypothetical protein
MTPSEELKLQLIELCGSLESAQAAFTWVVEVPPVPADPAPTKEGIVLTDDEVLTLDADALKKMAMERLAAKQNAPVAEVA